MNGFKAVLGFCVLFLPMMALAGQKMTFGRYQARAIFEQSSGHCPAPLVVMQTGSGPNGPDEMVPGQMTADGKDHSLFAEFSEGLRRGGVGTLAVGKPGIEFFKSWQPQDLFYDQKMHLELGWQDLIDNLFDAMTLGKTLPCVDPKRIYIFGHSEGTQVAVDYAHQHGDVKGLIMVGYSGEPLAATVDWQLFRRAIDLFIATDVDANHDNAVSLAEAQPWPEFSWNWRPGQKQVTFVEIEAAMRADQNLKAEVTYLESAPIWKGVWNRPAIYKETAELPQDIFIFTGSADIQTRPEEALRARQECVKTKKTNCTVQIIPGLGHGMSEPKAPRKHKLLDATIGPVDEAFRSLLGKTAAKF